MSKSGSQTPLSTECEAFFESQKSGKREDNKAIASEAGRLGTRALLETALGNPLADSEMLRTLVGFLPRSILAQALKAIANEASVSPYRDANKTDGDVARRHEIADTELGHKIIPANLLPAIQAPEDNQCYPVLTLNDLALIWQGGSYRFNETREPNKRIMQFNARLLLRDQVDIGYSDLCEQYGVNPPINPVERRTARALFGSLQNVPFLIASSDSALPNVDPRAVFVYSRPTIYEF
jgi:hypothetical protein